MKSETTPSRTLRLGIVPLIISVSIILVCLCAGMAIASSSEGHEAVHHGWASTDTYRIICFAVLAGGLFFILKKPVPAALNSRIKGIKDELDELDSKKAEAENLLSQYNEKLSRLSEESEKIIAQYVEQGKESRDKIINAAQSTAKKLEEQAQKSIKNEFEKAKASVMSEIIEKALSKAEKIIKKKISSSDQNKLVDEYLKKVVG